MLGDEETPQVTFTVFKVIVNNVIGLYWVQVPGEPFEYGRK